jgi:heme exporter protein D
VTGWLWFALVVSLASILVAVVAVVISIDTIRRNRRATEILERSSDTRPDQPD